MKKTRTKWVCAFLLGGMLWSLTGCGQSLSDDYVEIKQYKNLEVEEATEVDIDEQVENTIQNALSNGAERVEVTDRGAQNGDVVTMDYAGTIDGTAFEGGTVTGASVTLGSGQLPAAEGDQKGFEEQIEGHRAGEEFDITIQFPTVYTAELAGKIANFHIVLQKVEEVKLPELTDEWVQTTLGYSTVEEYRTELYETYEATAEERIWQLQKNAVLSAFSEQITVKQGLVEEAEKQCETEVEEYTGYAQQRGLSLEDYVKQYLGASTEEEFRETLYQSAEDTLKLEKACQLLAQKENLEPSEEEYEQLMEEEAKESGYSSLEEYESINGTEQLKANILQEKVAEYLLEHSVEKTDSETNNE